MRKKGSLGQQDLASDNSEFNAQAFLVRQMLSRLNIATLVKVKAVHGTGVAPVGTVDVQPLVNLVDGGGAPMAHTTIYGLPFFRLQGGTNAIICDPKAGDIGFCLFADRDLSVVKATGAAGNPGSKRRFDMADGLYIGGWNMGTTPSRYVQISDAGINITTPNDFQVNASTGEMTIPTLQITSSAGVTVTAPTLTVNGNLQVNGLISCNGGGGAGGTSTLQGTFQVTGDVVVNSISSKGHVHSGVQSGSSNTGGPH